MDLISIKLDFHSDVHAHFQSKILRYVQLILTNFSYFGGWNELIPSVLKRPDKRMSLKGFSFY